MQKVLNKILSIFNLKKTKSLHTNLIILLGYILLAIGIFIIFFFDMLFTIPNYTTKQNTRHDLYNVTSISVDDSAVYCLSQSKCAVDAYTKEGKFLYSLTVPFYQSGVNEIYVKSNVLYIKDRNHTLYYYRHGNFLGKITCDGDNKITLYDSNNNYAYSFFCSKDNIDYTPLYVDGDSIYFEGPDDCIYLYKKGVFVSNFPESEDDFLKQRTFAYDDSNGNEYCVDYTPPKLIKIDADYKQTVIAETNYWAWLKLSPVPGFAAILVGALLAFLIPAIHKRKNKKWDD